MLEFVRKGETAARVSTAFLRSTEHRGTLLTLMLLEQNKYFHTSSQIEIFSSVFLNVSFYHYYPK